MKYLIITENITTGEIDSRETNNYQLAKGCWVWAKDDEVVEVWDMEKDKLILRSKAMEENK